MIQPVYEPQIVTEPELDSDDLILARLKHYTDDEQTDKVYALRLVAANKLEIGPRGISTSFKGDGQSKYPEVNVKEWEEGRHNPVGVNTQVQVKALTFNAPIIEIDGIAPLAKKIRQAYILKEWEEQDISQTAQLMLEDGIISGEGTVFCEEYEDYCSLEWADALDVIWDNAFKEPHKRRFVFRRKHLPLIVALSHYPEIRSWFPGIELKGNELERDTPILCYFSKTTKAVIFKNKVVRSEPNTEIPAISLQFYREPSVKNPTGLVEKQMGMLRLFYKLQRALRDSALNTPAVGLATGPIEEAGLDRVEEGKEGVILRSPDASASFGWMQGGKLNPEYANLMNQLQQYLNEASGVQDFMKGRTDTQVNFASQLSMIASQSGIQGKYAQEQFEKAVIAMLKLFLRTAERAEKRDMTLNIDGHELEFSEDDAPIGPVLGDDGRMTLAPGGMVYKSAMQKLQETMMFLQAMASTNVVTPALQPLAVKLVAEAYNVQDTELWTQGAAEGAIQNAQLQAAETAKAAGGTGPLNDGSFA